MVSELRSAPFLPSRSCFLVSLVTFTPLFFMKVTICWPVASRTIFARVRLRKARLARGSSKGTAGPPNEPVGRFLSGLTSVLSIRMARLNLFSGTARPGLPASLKSYRRRKSAIQLADSFCSPNRSPLVAEKMNSQSSVPAPLSNSLFQL